MSRVDRQRVSWTWKTTVEMVQILDFGCIMGSCSLICTDLVPSLLGRTVRQYAPRITGSRWANAVTNRQHGLTTQPPGSCARQCKHNSPALQVSSSAWTGKITFSGLRNQLMCGGEHCRVAHMHWYFSMLLVPLVPSSVTRHAFACWGTILARLCLKHATSGPAKLFLPSPQNKGLLRPLHPMVAWQ